MCDMDTLSQDLLIHVLDCLKDDPCALAVAKCINRELNKHVDHVITTRDLSVDVVTKLMTIIGTLETMTHRVKIALMDTRGRTIFVVTTRHNKGITQYALDEDEQPLFNLNTNALPLIERYLRSVKHIVDASVWSMSSRNNNMALDLCARLESALPKESRVLLFGE